MKALERSTVIFALGGVIYILLELSWRGYSHISMGIAGGICLLGLYRIQKLELWLPAKCLIGALVITGVELITGCIVNLMLGLDVWDYSAMPLNFLGQICPVFTALWLVLCLPGLGLCALMVKIMEREYE